MMVTTGLMVEEIVDNGDDDDDDDGGDGGDGDGHGGDGDDDNDSVQCAMSERKTFRHVKN